MSIDGLSAGAVARRLGVAVTTLRTWHQRYGLGPSLHEPGRHRRYAPADLARLEVMRRLTGQGIPAAEAARWALGMSTDPTGAGAGTGTTVAAGQAAPRARGLGRAAMRLDAAAARELLERSVAEIGVVPTWDQVVCPVLTSIGRRHSATARLVDVEHLLSRCVSEVFGAVPRPAVDGRPVRTLLACTDDEQHSLPLEALAAALAEADVPCRQLGARVPPSALADAMRRTGPAVVVLWSHAGATADVSQLTGVLDQREWPLLLIAAGPGWDPDKVPPEVARPAELAEAVALVLAADQV